MFAQAGAECGRGVSQRGPFAPRPVDTSSAVSAPPAAPRRSRACRTPHAEWRRQAPARPRAWGRGRRASCAAASRPPPAGAATAERGRGKLVQLV